MSSSSTGALGGPLRPLDRMLESVVNEDDESVSYGDLQSCLEDLLIHVTAEHVEVCKK